MTVVTVPHTQITSDVLDLAAVGRYGLKKVHHIADESLTQLDAQVYANVLAQHGVLELFDLLTISEHLGCEKPDPRMFTTTLDRLGIVPAEYGRTLMVGNHLERDVKGANQVGMISVWLDWAPRRPKVPADENETPDYTIRLPIELLAVVDEVEARLAATSQAPEER